MASLAFFTPSSRPNTRGGGGGGGGRAPRGGRGAALPAHAATRAALANGRGGGDDKKHREIRNQNAATATSATDVEVGLHSLPGMSLDWLRGSYWLPSIGCVLVSTPGCQTGCMDHAGCQQLNRVLTAKRRE
jgi:hypothetical protein